MSGAGSLLVSLRSGELRCLCVASGEQRWSLKVAGGGDGVEHQVIDNLKKQVMLLEADNRALRELSPQVLHLTCASDTTVVSSIQR